MFFRETLGWFRDALGFWFTWVQKAWTWFIGGLRFRMFFGIGVIIAVGSSIRAVFNMISDLLGDSLAIVSTTAGSMEGVVDGWSGIPTWLSNAACVAYILNFETAVAWSINVMTIFFSACLYRFLKGLIPTMGGT